jgi:hypothetical protein
MNTGQNTQTLISRSAVRRGLLQSMPSSSIDNCARRKETVPVVAWGHTKRPRSSRFWNRHSPSPSNQSNFTVSPRRPRKAKTCPEYGFSLSTPCTCAARPGRPRRISVTPAAIQICVAGPGCFKPTSITPEDSEQPPRPARGRRCLQSRPQLRLEDRHESSPESRRPAARSKADHNS